MKPHASIHRLPKHPAGLRQQRGVSMVELMIAVVIGMVTIGAVMAAYLAASQASRHSRSLAQMSEDANAAFSVLRNHLMMAGYSAPTGASGQKMSLGYTGRQLMGCNGSFANTALALEALTCTAVPAGQTAPNALAVAFQADTRNAPNVSGVPVDCLGNSLALEGGMYISRARFYLDQPTGSSTSALYCRGNASNAGQALVENIEDLQFRYGIQGTPRGPVTAYSDAASMSAAQFDSVATVRVCVVVASDGPILDEPTAYTPCFPAAYNTKVTPTDKRLYRAFNSTILLQNRAAIVEPEL